jgi:hypothetical protein
MRQTIAESESSREELGVTWEQASADRWSSTVERTIVGRAYRRGRCLLPGLSNNRRIRRAARCVAVGDAQPPGRGGAAASRSFGSTSPGRKWKRTLVMKRSPAYMKTAMNTAELTDPLTEAPERRESHALPTPPATEITRVKAREGGRRHRGGNASSSRECGSLIDVPLAPSRRRPSKCRRPTLRQPTGRS